MENHRILKFRNWPAVAKGLLYGGLVGCVLTIVLHGLYLWLSFGGGEGLGVLVACAWRVFVNALTATVCRVFGVEWDLGTWSKPSPTQFFFILVVNTVACSTFGAILGCAKHVVSRRK